MRKEVTNNDDVSDVDLGDCWHSTDRAADCGNREAAKKIRLRYERRARLDVSAVAMHT